MPEVMDELVKEVKELRRDNKRVEKLLLMIFQELEKIRKGEMI